MTRDPLDVWLYGINVAQLAETGEDRLELTWTEAARERWPAGTRLLSAKLTIGTRPVHGLVRAYLDGLLPEGNARINSAMTAGVPPDDTLALIRAYGRDTPGAAIFVQAGSEDPTRAGHYEPLSLASVAARLRRADEHQPATPQETTESSTVPGMVPKITLHREDSQWLACKGGAPSTWILKRAQAADTGIGDIVDTEVACLALARELELTSIAAEVLDFGDVRAIAVSRYDRDPARGNARIHQEDLAQALGLNTADPNRKFQWGAKMPSLRDAAKVLLLDGGNPDALLRLVTFSFLVGNTDMHAKNISFLRHPDGRVELSPAYDIAMHLHHVRDNRRFALDLAGRNRMDELGTGDVLAEARSWPAMTVSRARRVVAETTERLAVALDDIDRDAHPGVPAPAWELVEKRTQDALSALRETQVRTLDAAPVAPDAVDAGGSVPATRPRRRRGPRKPH